MAGLEIRMMLKFISDKLIENKHSTIKCTQRGNSTDKVKLESEKTMNTIRRKGRSQGQELSKL